SDPAPRPGNRNRRGADDVRCQQAPGSIAQLPVKNRADLSCLAALDELDVAVVAQVRPGARLLPVEVPALGRGDPPVELSAQRQSPGSPRAGGALRGRDVAGSQADLDVVLPLAGKRSRPSD